MPVLVHAAHRPLARALISLLLAEGGQVRATAAADVASLRGAGVFTAGCDADDEGTLEAALTGVHTLVVLLGGLGVSDPLQVRSEGLAAARAAEGAGVARTVLVTLSGSDRAARDPLRQAHAEVATAFAALDLPTVEVRTGLVATPAVRGVLRAAGLGARADQIEVAPVPARALLHLLVAIDAARGRATTGHLVVAADGPVRLRLRAFVDAAPDAGRVGRRIPGEAARDLLLQVLDGPWWTEDPTVPDGWRTFGVGVGGGAVEPSGRVDL